MLAKNIYVNDAEKKPLRAFIQPESDCKGVFVTNKSANGFDVIELDGGMSSVPFSWTLTANRADATDDHGNVISKIQSLRLPEGVDSASSVTAHPEKRVMPIPVSRPNVPLKGAGRLD